MSVKAVLAQLLEFNPTLTKDAIACFGDDMESILTSMGVPAELVQGVMANASEIRAPVYIRPTAKKDLTLS